MIGTVERILFLRGIPLLTDFSLDELWQVSRVITETPFEAGQALIVEGDYGDALYLIIQGEVRVHKGEKLLARYGRGDMIGELALLDGEPRSASVTAATEVRALRLERGQFEDIMRANPSAAIGVIKVLTRRIRTLSELSRGMAEIPTDD